MRARSIVPLIIGLGVGFFAIKMGIDMVKKAKGDQGGEKKVFVAASPIEVACRITDKMLTTKAMAAGMVSDDAFTDLKALVGRVTKMSIPPGVAITRGMLAPPGSEPGLRAMIPEGFRAVSVKVSESTAVAGFVQPGSRVDVFALRTARDPNAQGQLNVFSQLILSDIEVGAVGQTLSEVAADGKKMFKSKSVTLIVRSDEVAVLHAAASKGEVHLALRGAGEKPGEKPPPEAEKVVSVPAAAPALPLETGHTVQIVHGNRLETVVFDEFGRPEAGPAGSRYVPAPVSKSTPQHAAGESERTRSSTSETIE